MSSSSQHTQTSSKTSVSVWYGFILKADAPKRVVLLRLPYNVFVQSKMAALRGRVVTECLSTCMFRQTSTASISTLPTVKIGNKVSGILIVFNLLPKTRANIVLHVTWLWQKLNGMAEVVKLEPVFMSLNLIFKRLKTQVTFGLI